MLVLTRKNRESIVIGRPDDQEVVMVITILSVEGRGTMSRAVTVMH